MRFRFSLIFILTIFIITSCHKDTESYNDDILNTFSVQVYQEITSTIVGYVYDENNQPVANADVAIYSASTKTNKHGVFVFKNVKMDQQGTYIKVLKDGYILGSDFVYPSAGTTCFANIKIMALDKDQSFDASAGGTITAKGGGKVLFPSDAITDMEGNAYNGKVTVTAKYLHPQEKELGNLMPGALIADAINGNTVVLGTLGMMAVELRDINNKELQLKAGKKAIIEFPVSVSYKPTTIELWSFDENKGRWKEEGKAVLAGDVYKAEVGHFSFWNCDAPFPLVEVCGKILYDDGSPAVNIGVVVEAEGLGTSYGTTNNNGEFCGKMPKGKKLTFKISHYNCTSEIDEVTLGPFQNNTIIDNIIIHQIPSFVVTGSIQCNSIAVDEGIIVIKIKESTLVFPAKEDGTFSIDLTQYICGEELPVTIFGFDNNSTETSPVLTLTNTTSQNILLNVCTSACDFTGNLVFDCVDKVSAVITGGSGNFTYTWEDNSTGSFYTIPNQDSIFENKTYCITVTDTGAGCEKTFCKKIGGKIFAGMEVDCQNGKFYVYQNGGVAPYTYNWSNGATSREITASVPGTYCVTVSDANGCTGSACNVWSGPKFIESSPTSCDKNTYNIPSSPFSQGYYYANGTTIQGQLTFPISVNVFQTGFTFGINAFESNCSFNGQIKLPQLVQGLTTTVVNTSCGTCNDGKINITVNTGAQCYSCQAGQTKVFDINDINTDLTTNNNAGNMAKGEYYVVVTDATTGCYIAFNKVKIQ